MPLPTLYLAFIDIMPVKCIEELDFVENDLFEQNIEHINYKEGLGCSLLIC